jgi:predicted nucleotidyltransferase
LIDDNKLIKWLTDQFKQLVPTPIYVAVFGSYAMGSPNPEDCDILIVLQLPIGNLQWLSVHESLTNLKKKFEHYFGLRLSPTVMTLEEVHEKGSFISSILKKPLRDLLGFKIDLIDKIENAEAGHPTYL